MEINDLKNGDLLDFDKTFAYFSEMHPDKELKYKDLVKDFVDAYNAPYLASNIDDTCIFGFSLLDPYLYTPIVVEERIVKNNKFEENSMIVVQVLEPFEGEYTSDEIITRKSFRVVKHISIEQYQEIINKRVKGLKAFIGLKELERVKRFKKKTMSCFWLNQTLDYLGIDFDAGWKCFNQEFPVKPLKKNVIRDTFKKMHKKILEGKL